MGGSLLSLVLLSALGSLVQEQGALLMYGLLGFGTAVMIAYLITVTGAVWMLYERASEANEQMNKMAEITRS